MSPTVKTIADCLNIAAAKVFTFSEDRSIAVSLCCVLLPAVYFCSISPLKIKESLCVTINIYDYLNFVLLHCCTHETHDGFMPAVWGAAVAGTILMIITILWWMLQTAAVLRAASRWAACRVSAAVRTLVYFPHYFGPAARRQPPCPAPGGRHLLLLQSVLGPPSKEVLILSITYCPLSRLRIGGQCTIIMRVS